MVSLGPENVRIAANARDKADAIRQAGGILVEGGYIQPGYVESMMRRETVTATYLGNGIAIPHGLPQDRELILHTGLSVLQLPYGVEWNPGEIVHLVVGIAARSDEHIGVLQKLTDVLDDEATVMRLARTGDIDEIVAALDPARSREASAPTPPATVVPFLGGGMRAEVEVTGGTGLHARPASIFVTLAKQFNSDIRVSHQGKTANGKSMVSMLRLGVESGGVISISADGPDAEKALHTLIDAVESGLGEEDEAAHAAPKAAPDVQPAGQAIPHATPDDEPGLIRGVAAAPGIAIAPLHQLRKQVEEDIERHAINSDAERADFDHAIDRAGAELDELHRTVERRAGEMEARIFAAHREFLDDPDLIDAVRHRIGLGETAAYAWRETIEERAEDLAGLSDPLLAGRANDLRDVGARVLRLLIRRNEQESNLPDHEIILVAEDLTPSDTASLDPDLVKGILTALGGPNSHTAILARSLDIPAVVGAGHEVLDLATGVTAVLDGSRGTVLPDPDAARLETARSAQHGAGQRRAEVLQAAYRPAITIDGHRVEVAANIGAVPEAGRAVQAGGEAVGLLRTEFLFQDRTDPPSEEEQYEAYRAMAEALGGLPLIVRTLDAGGDKPLPYIAMAHEDNPFLGQRGIRLSFTMPDLFRSQLRAILRAASHGEIKIMFPMITSVAEFRRGRALVEEIRREVDGPEIDVGIMVEVPSSAVMADLLAREVDFFSIGTNDLTQYTLAMDRGHPALAREADGLHPAVLRMVDQTVRAAHGEGKWVGVCGNLAADPVAAPILIGLDVDELSVGVPNIPALKAQIRSMAYEDAKDLARRALACDGAAEVRALTSEAA
ncbi:PTS fructose transporter subunit IIA [Skermanella stibiiresistens SB22]|uniref:Multiphosphoryl transfer protein n=1 Tax=Skermanella stibiiresistens SB22 TaxID=1385369 RepID=W9GWF6_9PROT|nr:phosphoenolpyruvate--protein phosphotransferase [Skermanella stibiiresistens]EWY36986.1 PTS fructose transporter subunit IIA [Skermanella stibiiresistens SB22]